ASPDELDDDDDEIPVDISTLPQPPENDVDVPEASAETATETATVTETVPDPVTAPAIIPTVGLPPEYPRRGKDRFLRLATSCPVRAQPRQDSAQLYELKPGRVLWVEQLNSHWYVVYRKNGAAFMDPNCFKAGSQISSLAYVGNASSRTLLRER
ncbi:MAG: hypothetical protein ABL958_12365, partial [Bdellovibrionia bacterium]